MCQILKLQKSLQLPLARRRDTSLCQGTEPFLTLITLLRCGAPGDATMKSESNLLNGESHQKLRDQGPRRILEHNRRRAVQCRALALVNGLLELRHRHKVSMRRKEEEEEEEGGRRPGLYSPGRGHHVSW